MYNTEKKCIGLIFHFIFQCYKRKYHFPDLAIPAWMVQRLEASDQTSSTIASCMKYSVQSNCLTKPTVELQTPSEMWRLAHKRWPNQPKGEKGGLNEYCLPISWKCLNLLKAECRRKKTSFHTVLSAETRILQSGKKWKKKLWFNLCWYGILPSPLSNFIPKWSNFI